ncbi:MAG TPA: type III-A CRISPR-associated protein Csm2 [Roseiarcus sp.]|nr:type III-A CRISPR-associated protein Csm2 [Roseiarcus sp.]
MNDRNPHRNPSHQNRPRSSEDDNRPVLTSEEVQAILSGDANKLNDAAQKIANGCGNLPPTQMRNFYGPIVRLRNELASEPNADLSIRHAHDLMMHRVRLVYMAARNNAARPLQKSFAELVAAAISNNRRVEKEKVQAICDFAEAVVAYHYSQTKGKTA